MLCWETNRNNLQWIFYVNQGTRMKRRTRDSAAFISCNWWNYTVRSGTSQQPPLCDQVTQGRARPPKKRNISAFSALESSEKGMCSVQRCKINVCTSKMINYGRFPNVPPKQLFDRIAISGFKGTRGSSWMVSDEGWDSGFLIALFKKR